MRASGEGTAVSLHSDRMYQFVRRGIDPTGSPLSVILGPLLFALSLVVPTDLNWKVTGAVGLFAWVLVWLVTRCVRIELTFLVPPLVPLVVPLAPWWQLVEVYWSPLVLFIIGAVGVAMGWQYWGLTERLALRSLLFVGGGAKRQVLAWLVVSATFSAVIPDTVTAAMLVPIAVTLLRYQGYATVEEIRTANYPSLVLLAIGWGAAVGGSATPLGGGMDILTIELLSEYVGYQVSFVSWLYHLLPFTVLSLLLVSSYVYVVFDIDTDVRRANSFYSRELADLGGVSREEYIVGSLWILAFLAVFLEPLYTDIVVAFAPWFNPLFVFPAVFGLLFLLPTHTEENGRIMNRDALTEFPVAVLFIWPGAIILARILIESGAIAQLGGLVSPYLVLGFTGFLVLAIVAVLITNLTTNTAAAAALVPLVIAVAAAAGLPVAAFVYAMAAMINISYALPSANGCLAITTGFGANVNKLIRHGTVLCLLNILLVAAYATVASLFVPGWTQP